jgi:hypothetical protein
MSVKLLDHMNCSYCLLMPSRLFLEIDAVQRLEKGQTESSSSKSIGCVQKTLLEAFGNLRHLMKDSGELCPAAAQALFVAKAISVS